MAEFEYVCTDCGRQLGVDAPGREAILRHGCPVCGAAARVDAFGPRRK